MMEAEQKKKLEEFWKAESKYNIVPLPVPLSRSVVIDFCQRKLARESQALEALGKVQRLCLFNDLNELSPDWVSLTRATENSATDINRLARAIQTLGWIGDNASKDIARKAFQKAIRREGWLERLAEIWLAAFYLGDDESWKALQFSLADEQGRFSSKQRDLQKAGRQAEAIHQENQGSRLKEFESLEMARLKQANEARKNLLEIKDLKGRIEKTVLIYMRKADLGMEEMAHWAGYHALREARMSRDAATLLAETFLSLARPLEAASLENNPEAVLNRHRALKAADLFGAMLEPKERIWLGMVKDTGTDLLAERSDWEYMGHQH